MYICIFVLPSVQYRLHQGLFKQPIHEHNEEHELEEPEEQELEVEIARNCHIVSIVQYQIVMAAMARLHHRFVVVQTSTGDSRHWNRIMKDEHLLEHCLFKPGGNLDRSKIIQASCVHEGAHSTGSTSSSA